MKKSVHEFEEDPFSLDIPHHDGHLRRRGAKSRREQEVSRRRSRRKPKSPGFENHQSPAEKQKNKMWAAAFRCGNAAVVRYMRRNVIDISQPRILLRRFNEFGHIRNNLGYGVRGMSLRSKLRSCRIKKPCGLPFCVICRSVSENEVIRRLNKLFLDKVDAELFWETIIVGAFTESQLMMNSLFKEKRGQIIRKIRNFLYRLGTEFRRYADIRKFGYFELDYYRISDLQALLKKVEGDLSSKKKDKLRKIRQKAKLIIRLAKDSGASAEDPSGVWMLHLHCITNLPAGKEMREEYVNRLRSKTMFPGRRRVLIKPLHSWRSRAENFRNLASYMKKTSPTYGTLYSQKATLLGWDSMIEFFNLHEELRDRDMRFSFGASDKKGSEK